MFRMFAKKGTEWSHHFLDWSRVGILIRSGRHRYTQQELIARGTIIVCTATSAFLGTYLNDENSSDLQGGIVGAIAGLVVSHVVVMAPLLKKRCKIAQECETLAAEMKTKAQEHPEVAETISNVVNYIQHISLSDEQDARATQTWGYRKRLLSTVNEKLDVFDHSFWQANIESIIEKLQENSFKLKR